MNLRAWLGLSSNKGNNDYYVTTRPTPQTAVDLFKNEWSSKLPEPFDNLQTGPIGLFKDDRIQWFAQEAGIEGKTVLELGPLEGGHSYMLDRFGAKEVTAIEANSRAFLKCLVAKEILGMPKVKFQLGDFLEHLRAEDCPQYEICVASGVLYHMQNPAELIALLAKRCTGHLFLWTHYYDENAIKAKNLQKKFPHSHQFDYLGFKHTLHRQEYGVALKWGGFCGGSANFSHWMTREDQTRCLEYFGFRNMKINFDQKDHQNGPAWALTASKG